MKARVLILCLVLAVMASALPLAAQPILAIDFNQRTNTAANTQSGFQPFLIESNGAANAVQTVPTTRTFGSITVTVSNSGTPGYDDRVRANPTDNGAFASGALLRDFIFSRENAGNSGLNISISGLTPDTSYRFSIWSFDASSAGNRMSDWAANSIVITNGYAFDGRVAPTTAQSYRFGFLATADSFGTVLITGRRNSASVNQNGTADLGVFLNALMIEPPEAVPPTITSTPSDLELFAGDNAILTIGADGTQPLFFQWLKNSTQAVENAISPVLVASNQIETATYSVIVSNAAGSLTSAPVSVVVHPVTNLASGLIAYWPLDELTAVTEDLSGNNQTFWATNMDTPNLVQGQRNKAVFFNGTDQFLKRSLASEPLPAARYPAYTIAMWVNAFGSGQSDRRVYAESSSVATGPLLSIGTDSAGASGIVDLFIRNDNGSTPINHRKSSLIAFDGAWHHIAWVDNNGYGTLFVDGVPDTNNFNYTRGTITSDIVTLGAIYRDTANPIITAFFNGTVDDVAVWRRSLSSNEIATVRANGPLLPRPNFTQTAVTNGVVTLTYFSASPGSPEELEQTIDLGSTPIIWTPVTNAVVSVNGDFVTASFPQPASSQAFYRVKQ